MQLMPETALELGVSDVNDPEQNIRAGSLYLKRLYEQWENIPDSIQRQPLTGRSKRSKGVLPWNILMLVNKGVSP